MSNRIPIIRQIAWRAVAVQLAVVVLLIAAASVFRPEDGLIWAFVAYFAYALGARYLVTFDHRAGVQLVKREQFAEAIPRFQKSCHFFERHLWVDRFRSLVLLSPSAISYQEMALANMAFCFSQIGDGAQARRYYEMCLDRFPGNGIATSALRMMDSAVAATREL